MRSLTRVILQESRKRNLRRINITEEQLKYAQRNRGHMQNMFSTGMTAPRTNKAVRRDAQTPEPEPETRKPGLPGDSAETTKAKQVAYDKLRARRARAQEWNTKTSGPTPYPSTSEVPGTERGVPTTRARRQAANMLRAATGKPLLKVDSITPLTLPMIAEGSKAAREREEAILNTLHRTGKKDSAAAEYIRSRKASRGSGRSLATKIARLRKKNPETQPSDADTSPGKAAAKPRKEIAAGTWQGRERPFDLGRTVPKSEADKWEDEDRDYT